MTHATEQSEPRRHVLIVEDEPRLGQVLGQAMVELGYTATVVRTGEEAMRRMGESPHSILILDLNLPGMSGLDVLEKVRAAHGDVAAIILTGFGDLDSAKRAIHLDVVEFLTKPAHLGELEIALNRAEQRLRERDIERLRQRLHEGIEASTSGDGGRNPVDAALKLEELEKHAILASLERHDGNREKTAKELGISVRTLYYRLSQYDPRK
ncbi:MAG: response regulator transcription factor [Phycisphaerales bacterium]